MAVGTLQLLRSPDVSILGARFLLFDVGGVVAMAGLLATFVVSSVINTRTLYRREPLPPRPSGTTEIQLLAARLKPRPTVLRRSAVPHLSSARLKLALGRFRRSAELQLREVSAMISP